MVTAEQLNADFERLSQTALRVKEDRDLLVSVSRTVLFKLQHETLNKSLADDTREWIAHQAREFEKALARVARPIGEK